MFEVSADAGELVEQESDALDRVAADLVAEVVHLVAGRPAPPG